MLTPKHRRDIEPTLQEELVEGVMFGLGTHDEKWSELGTSEDNAVIARNGLLKAAELRKEHGDGAADAYLAGLADFHAIFKRSGMVIGTMVEIANLPVTDEPI
jgi:hypothetical protein